MRKLMILLSLIPIAAMANPVEHAGQECGDKSHHHQMKHKKAGDIPFHLRDLDLTDTQTAQIKAMMEKRNADRQAQKGQSREIRKAIHDLTMSDNFNEAELESLIDQSMVLQKQRATERAKFHHDVFNVLTPEQQEQLKAKMAKFREKMRH